MNIIATINDTLLPIVLFAIYFIFASVVRYNLKNKANVFTDKEVTKTSESLCEEQSKSFTYKEAFSAQFDPAPFGAIAEEIVATLQPENIVSVATQTTKNQAVNSQTTISENSGSMLEIIDSLGKRELRKLCSPLGIKQKTNGTELTTEFMKVIIKRKFDENPVQVVEVMSDRLPQLLPIFPEFNQQQQLERKAC